MIAHEALKPAYGYRCSFFTQYAHLLALCFLRAHAPAYCGESVIGLYLIYRAVKISLCHILQENWYLNFDRAAFHARRFLALDTTLCLFNRLLFRKPKSHFIKISCTDLRILHWHLLAL